MALQAGRLGDVVAQACLSVARMVRVVEKTHNSKTAKALDSETAPREGLSGGH